MRKLKYSLASTLDGYIAKEDGSFDCFLMEGEHVTDFMNSFQAFDAVLMGRKTYEVGLKMGQTSYPGMRNYVFSRTLGSSSDENVEIVSQDAVNRVREIKQKEGKDIWLCGGGELATLLQKAGLIDEIILKVNPILLGSGIPLLSGGIQKTELKLSDSKTYTNGVVLLKYEV